MDEKNGSRERIIVRKSIIGIVANIFLAAFKAAIGVLSHSVAVVMDAVNNLSDAMSSLITIIGVKLSAKKPDRKHPLGYGRIEYLSAAIISVIVLYAGITSLTESVKSIIDPAVPDYSKTALIIIVAGVIVKIVLGQYVKKTGKKVDSDALVASGSDALFDAVITASTLVAAIIYIVFHISLEAWLGAIISIIIIKSGIEMLRDTMSRILGERIDSELSKAVKETIASFPGVNGAYDLILHNYGPEKLVGSVHIEVPDTMTAKELDTLDREITKKVYEDHGVAIAGISVYSKNTSGNEAARTEEAIRQVVGKKPGILSIHGFYQDENSIRFDMVMDFDVKDKEALYEEVLGQCRTMYPGYDISILVDTDISD